MRREGWRLAANARRPIEKEKKKEKREVKSLGRRPCLVTDRPGSVEGSATGPCLQARRSRPLRGDGIHQASTASTASCCRHRAPKRGVGGVRWWTIDTHRYKCAIVTYTKSCVKKVLATNYRTRPHTRHTAFQSPLGGQQAETLSTSFEPRREVGEAVTAREC